MVRSFALLVALVLATGNIFAQAADTPDALAKSLQARYQNVKDFCDRYGKMFVKLPAGYHPNQVAHQVLAQAGDRLRSAVPTG